MATTKKPKSPSSHADQEVTPPPNPFAYGEDAEAISEDKKEEDGTADELPADAHISPEASLSYWSNISPDVNGMLGGYPQVSRIDLQGSRNFLNKLQRLAAARSQSSAAATSSSSSSSSQSSSTKKFSLAVDCGAGIGRITEGLLLDLCSEVDIVEPIDKFARTLEAKHKPDPEQSSSTSTKGRLGEIFITPLEHWRPPTVKHHRYNLIWNQWCLGHLRDAELVTYLRYSATQLLNVADPGAVVVVKENLSTDPFGADIYDDTDSSVTRSDAKFRDIFSQAGLEIVRMELQNGMPKSLYPVKMYALRPKKEEVEEEQKVDS